MERRKVQMMIPGDLIDKIDRYAKEMSLTRTSAIIVLCSTALKSADTLDALIDLSAMAKFNQQAENFEELLEKEDKFEV